LVGAFDPAVVVADNDDEELDTLEEVVAGIEARFGCGLKSKSNGSGNSLNASSLRFFPLGDDGGDIETGFDAEDPGGVEEWDI